MDNAYHSKEHLRWLAAMDWLWDTFPAGEEVHPLGNYTVRAQIYRGCGPGPDGAEVNLWGRRAILTGPGGEKLLHWASTNDHLLLALIPHRDGREYLFFSTGLYGYSVHCISSGETAHYLPRQALEGGESFIHLDALYCPQNNLLAVNGCWWACPWSCVVYDFSHPLCLPLPLVADTFQLDALPNLDIDSDIQATGFDRQGRCLLRCGNQSIPVDILTRFSPENTPSPERTGGTP